ASGNLAVQAAPPGAGALAANPVLTYNSQVSTTGELGNGWSSTFQRKVQPGGGLAPIVVAGAGQSYKYSMKPGGIYVPGTGAINALTGNPSSFNETAPDGTVYHFTPDHTLGPCFLRYVQNASGARWSVTYDSGGRVVRVTDPLVRLATLAYTGSNKIRRIQDASLRITTVSVNASGNLARIVSPELCISSMIYDGSNRMVAWINPLGDRTSYSFDGSSRVTRVQLPLGQRFSLSYPSATKTVLIDPRGNRTTQVFNSSGFLLSATNGAGMRTTHGYDSNNYLTYVQDGLGRRFTFGYVTTANSVSQLSVIRTSLGSRFSYLYDSNSRVRAVVDQTGN